MNYIDKLKNVIAARDMSIRTLSQSCNLTERGIYRILKKEGNPSIYSIEQICEALNIRIVDLFCEKEDIIIRNYCTEIDILKAIDSLSQDAQSHLLWIADKLKGH